MPLCHHLTRGIRCTAVCLTPIARGGPLSAGRTDARGGSVSREATAIGMQAASQLRRGRTHNLAVSLGQASRATCMRHTALAIKRSFVPRLSTHCCIAAALPRRTMSSTAPTIPASAAASNGDSADGTHVTVPKSAVDFFSQAAPRLHAYVRELQSENAALRSQNATLRADAEILDGISDFLAEMSKSDLNYAQFMKLKTKQVEDEKRAAAAAAAAKAGGATKLPLPPLKDVPPTAASAAASSSPATAASRAPASSSADASVSPAAAASSTPPARPRSPRVRVSQKRPAPKPVGSGAHWTFTPASGSNPALRHLTPYDHEYGSFAKTRWIGRSVLAVLCSDFKPPASAASADEDGEGASASASTPSAAESFYRAAITSGRVLVNDAPVSPEYVLQSGDHLRQRVHRHEPPVPDFNAAEGHRVRIISDSPDLLVVDKPSGIPVHESGKYFHQSLLGVLFNQLAAPGSPAPTLLPVHRLDKLTSGVVLLAKNPATAARIGAIIKGEGDKDDEDETSNASNGSSAPAASADQLRKVYLARVNGRFPSSPADLLAAVAGVQPSLTAEGFLCLSAPLRVISARAGLHAVDFGAAGCESSSAGPKPAVTLFRVRSYDARSDTSVVEVHPQTGRTHQIRVHLQHLGFPITNDPVYGGALYEGNSYGPTGEPHPDPAVRTKQPGAWDASCADCVNQLYYAASKDGLTRYGTGIWLHALSYSFTPAAATSATDAASASPSGFSFTSAPVDWADTTFNVVAALGKRVTATAKASDLLAAAAAASASAAASSAAVSPVSSASASSSSASASPPPPSLCIRASLALDVGAITRIYAHHVSHGTASFEEIPPSEAEMSARRTEVLSRGLPFLVATLPSADPAAPPTVVGFAYANLFRLRTAYRFTVEDSIYLDSQYCARRGVGAALLRPLLSQLQSAGYRQVLAVIGDSANAASIGLHSKFGFQHLGTMQRVGLKFGRWLDVVFMQLDLAQGDQSIPTSDPKPCVEVNDGSGSK